MGVRQGLEVEVRQGEVLVPPGKPILPLGRPGLVNTHLCSGNLFSPEGLCETAQQLLYSISVGVRAGGEK